MRFVIEHPWASGCIFGSVAYACIWTGLRDGRSTRTKLGYCFLCLAIAAAITGNILSTKREHATRVVRGLIDSVLEQDIAGLRQYVSRDVCVEDAIHRSFTGTIDGVIEGVRYVHKEIPPTSNTIILFEVFEREADAIVEVAVLTRLKRLGTIPSTWRFRVSPNKTGVWKVTSIDPVEIAFRSYR